MSWRTAMAVLAVVVGAVVASLAFVTTLASKVDLALHDASPTAHSDYRAQFASDIQHVRDNTNSKAASLAEQLNAQGAAIEAVRSSLNEDRSETLADRVADRVKDARASREVWQRTKWRALANLQSGKPIREGIDAL